MAVILACRVPEDAHREHRAGDGDSVRLDRIEPLLQAAGAFHFLPSTRRNSALIAWIADQLSIMSAMSQHATAPMATPAQRLYQHDDRIQSIVSRPQASMKRSKRLTS
jgi:hypothetical protein